MCTNGIFICKKYLKEYENIFKNHKKIKGNDNIRNSGPRVNIDFKYINNKC